MQNCGAAALNKPEADILRKLLVLADLLGLSRQRYLRQPLPCSFALCQIGNTDFNCAGRRKCTLINVCVHAATLCRDWDTGRGPIDRIETWVIEDAVNDVVR